MNKQHYIWRMWIIEVKKYLGEDFMEFLLTEGSLSRALSICLSMREAP